MQKKILIAIGITFLFLGIGIQPVIAQQDKEIDIEYNELDSNQQDVKPISCILEVYTWCWTNWGPMPYPTIILCRDLDSFRIRFGTTILKGYKFFMGLQRGHTYKIYAAGGESEVITLSDYYNKISIRLRDLPPGYAL